MEEPERRRAPRTMVAKRPAAQVRGVPGVHLRDLSLTGAQIEHLALLRPGAACSLGLLPPCRNLHLPARVVWCAVIGRTRTIGGPSHLVARSGLRFHTLTGEQHAVLADTLRDLAAAPHPLVDRQQRSA